MRIDITVSIGYERKRPNYRGDRIEARLEGIGLLLAGSAVTVFLLVLVLPRILAWLASL